MLIEKKSNTKKLVKEYEGNLGSKLISCLDDEIINPPAGNDQLSELLLELN